MQLSVKSKPNNRLVYAGLLLILINIIFRRPELDVPGYYNIHYIWGNYYYFSTPLILLIAGRYLLTLIMSIWALRTARRLNRSSIFWFVFALFFAPLALIILGFLDVSLPKEMNNIYKQYKSDFYMERLKLRKDYQEGFISFEDMNTALDNLPEKYDNAMRKALEQKENTIQLAESREKELKEKLDKPIDEKDTIVKDKCPACLSEISEDNEICPDCGLVFK